MAVGTITRVTVDPHGTVNPLVVGDLKMTVTTVVGSASYTTGGDAVTAANLGLGTVLHTITTLTGGGASHAGAVNAEYIISSGLLQCWTSASAEVASSADLSGLTFTITAFGY